jgi:phosphonate transport system substrate-binding protein
MISTQIARDYNKGIDQLVDGDVDFARFGPASYVLAKGKNTDIEILAMEAVKGGKTFAGIICVHQDSTIKSLSQLKGRSFAFGNELSTIGRYLAQGQLLDVGIRGEDLAHYAFLGRHDRVGTAVGNGKFDAGALKLNTFKKLQKNKVAIRELYRFNNVTKPWIARAGIAPRIAAALREALLELSEPALLKSLKKSGFLPGNDKDYDPIRSAMKKSRQFNN